MFGNFAVLEQRGAFSRHLLTYDLTRVDGDHLPGSWYVVPYQHRLSPALLIDTNAPEPSATLLSVIDRCAAPGVYPELGAATDCLRRILEKWCLSWDDAFGIVRFLRTAQQLNRVAARLTVDPSVALSNLEYVAGRDALFARHTKSARSLLADPLCLTDLPKALWNAGASARRAFLAGGLVTDGRLPSHAKAPTGDERTDRSSGIIFLTGSLATRADEAVRHALPILAAGRSVAFVAGAEPISAYYRSRFDQVAPGRVVLWPGTARASSIRTPGGSVYVSTRQFSSAFLPDVGLIVVDIGIPSESPYFWQGFSQRSFLAAMADWSAEQAVPLRVGMSSPTLSVLNSCRASPDTWAQAKASTGRITESPTFLVRLSRPDSSPRGILLPSVLQRLRAVFDRRGIALVLLNVTGYATLVECAECGYAMACPTCGAMLSLTPSRDTLYCKQCGHAEPSTDECPNCRGTQLRARGYGLDRLQKELCRTFPATSVRPVGSTDALPNADLGSGPVIWLGTYADAQLVPVLKPSCIAFPDVSVGLRHPVFDNIEQLGAVVLGCVVETDPGSVLVQLDRRTLGLKDALLRAGSVDALKDEAVDRQSLDMPPFAFQFLVRVPCNASTPKPENVLKDLRDRLQKEGVLPLGLRVETSHPSAHPVSLSVEFRVPVSVPDGVPRVCRVLSTMPVFRRGDIRLY